MDGEKKTYIDKNMDHNLQGHYLFLISFLSVMGMSIIKINLVSLEFTKQKG